MTEVIVQGWAAEQNGLNSAWSCASRGLSYQPLPLYNGVQKSETNASCCRAYGISPRHVRGRTYDGKNNSNAGSYLHHSPAANPGKL